jgi:hypothetical protein
MDTVSIPYSFTEATSQLSSQLTVGDILHGHYWIYIYDFAHNRWFKYNDEQVAEVEEKIVYADTSAEGAGPYFVTYVREDIAGDLVEVVRRDLSGNMMSFGD